VKLGTFYSLGAAPLFVGIERGFFGKQGLEIDVQRTASASDVMGFLGTGHLDVAAGGPSAPLFNAIARDVPIKLVAPLGVVPDTRDDSPFPMVVRKDLYDSGALREVSQLRGRRIAITGLGSANHWNVARLLQTVNLRLEDVDVVGMDYADMVAAFRTGNLDAALVISPFDAQLQREDLAVILVPNMSPGEMVTGLMYGPQFMRERAEVARRFMVGYLNAIRAMHRDGLMAPENTAVYEKFTGQSPEVIRASKLLYFDPDLRMDMRGPLGYQQFLLAMKMVTYDTPLAEQQIVDRSFAEYALQRADPK
jgi:NitT/TauT family transport system substrate-binding protein